jgi:heme a synthase
MLHQYDKRIFWWLFTGAFLVFAMVVIGGITRLTRSGLSITEWNVIMGSIPPLSEADWNLAFDKYKQFPEFQKINYSMSLEEFKSIFWWEFIHRLIGRLIGLVFLVPFVYFLIKRSLSREMIIKLTGVFLLGAFQGFLGWYMVASGLVDNPHVSHYRLAAHLITAFLTFGYIWWLMLDVLYPLRTKVSGGSLYQTALAALLALALQIVYGAFVAGLKAGLIYNTWPKMGDSWLPEAVTSMEPAWRNLTENMAGVQFIHRYLAVLVVILIAAVYVISHRENGGEHIRKGARLAMYAVLLQFVLGILTLIYAVPILLGVMHQVVAFFLFAAVIYVVHRTKYGSKAELITSSGRTV